MTERGGDGLKELRAMLPSGMLIDVKATLAFPAGKYEVISVSNKGIKLQCGKKDPILFTTSQLQAVWSPGAVTAFGEDEGVLGAMGYHVGEAGRPAEVRRRILERAFLGPRTSLPQIGDVREWGEARSRRRLTKIATSIAAFARNAQRRGPSLRVAVEDWRNDLAWLRSAYASRAGVLRWPSIGSSWSHSR